MWQTNFLTCREKLPAAACVSLERGSRAVHRLGDGGGGSESPARPAAIFITSAKSRRTEDGSTLPWTAEEVDTEKTQDDGC